MNLEIQYSKQASIFIDKNKSLITEEKASDLIITAVKKILKIEITNIDLKRLKGHLKGKYRIKTGKIRIVFTFKQNESIFVFINAIKFRKDVYK